MSAATSFIARQPILDRKQKLFAYELLYRDGTGNHCSATPEKAARTTLDNSVVLGLESLCFGRPAFLNCTREVLVEGLLTLLPIESTIVEVLETIVPDARVISACEALKAAGFRIALDDFVPGSPLEPLMPFADFVKCDFPSLSVRQRSELPNRFAQLRIAALAEKVETHEDFEMAMQSGYSLFQGYFFCRPTVLATRTLPVNAVSHLRLLTALCRAEFDFDEVESIIRVDPALSYRLLKVLNSYTFGFNTEVRSIRHALLLLGQKEFRKWGIVTTFCQAATSKPDQLIVTALCRARCCELLASDLGYSSDEFFLAGLLSLLDAILDIPRAELLEHLPLSPAIREALTKEGHILGDALQLLTAYEKGLLETCNSIEAKMNLTNVDLAHIYFESVRWAEEASGRQA